MKCWQKLLPVLGTGSVRFPVCAFVRFLFVCMNKKEVQKFSLESLDFTANVLYLRYDKNETKIFKLFQSVCKRYTKRFKRNQRRTENPGRSQGMQQLPPIIYSLHRSPRCSSKSLGRLFMELQGAKQGNV